LVRFHGTDDDPRIGLSGDVLHRMCAEPSCDAGHDDNTQRFGLVHGLLSV
jgi:hypothetical protein